MRLIHPWRLWIGNARDLRDYAALRAAGVAATVDLALDEPVAPVRREMICCRFPLLDGGGNPLHLVRAAIDTTASLIRAGTPTLVACSAGMSRSPAITAAAVSLVSSQPPSECLRLVTVGAPADLSGGLWRQVLEALSRTSHLHRLLHPEPPEPFAEA